MPFFQNVKNALKEGHFYNNSIYGRYLKIVVETLLRVTNISYMSCRISRNHEININLYSVDRGEGKDENKKTNNYY